MKSTRDEWRHTSIAYMTSYLPASIKPPICRLSSTSTNCHEFPKTFSEISFIFVKWLIRYEKIDIRFCDVINEQMWTIVWRHLISILRFRSMSVSTPRVMKLNANFSECFYDNRDKNVLKIIEISWMTSSRDQRTLTDHARKKMRVTK